MWSRVRFQLPQSQTVLLQGILRGGRDYLCNTEIIRYKRAVLAKNNGQKWGKGKMGIK